MIGMIVIGEGELDEAPMLFIGENLGTRKVLYNGNKLIKKYLKQEYSLGYMNF